MFQFSGFPSIHYEFMYGYTGITLYEFPHSEIFGSKVACTSPKLIAAYHVLHRLLVPRHSPYALNNLTFSATYLLRTPSLCSLAQSVTYISMRLSLFVPRLGFLANLSPAFGLSSGSDFRHIFKTVACHKIFLNLMILQST